MCMYRLLTESVTRSITMVLMKVFHPSPLKAPSTLGFRNINDLSVTISVTVSMTNQ